MPDINLQTLRGIPRINCRTLKQRKADMCGAYSLVAALGVFGVFPSNAILPSSCCLKQSKNNKFHLRKEDSFRQLCKKIYSITGILNKGVNIPVSPELSEQADSYNSLVNMAKTVISLIGSAPKINFQPKGYDLFRSVYPNEKKHCEEIVGLENICIDAGSYAPPGPEETHVVCVFVENEKIHWLAQGSNGRFYDPQNGTLDNNWCPKKAFDAMGSNYSFSGLWIVIK